MHLTCFRCRNGFRITGFNLLRVDCSCPICGMDNNYANAIEREYGSHVGKEVRDLIRALDNVAHRSKDRDLSWLIEGTQNRIGEHVKEAIRENLQVQTV